MLYFKKYVISPSVRFFALEFPKTRRKGNWKMAEFSTSEHELVLVIDFGGQYNQLIARRVREHNIYCEVISYKTPIEQIKAKNPKGIIFTGGPRSVYLDDSPRMTKEIFELGVPIFGICYGAQFMVYGLGGTIGKANENAAAEFGRTECEFDTECAVFDGLKKNSVVWMSHNDYIEVLPDGFKAVGHSDKCPYAAIENVEKGFYATQFHPEVNHTEQGFDMLGNFLYKVCHCKGDWTMRNYAEEAIKQIREKVGDGKVLLALSGGVDSSVAAVLLNKAIGKNLTCIFVDHGLLRKNEFKEVMRDYEGLGLNVIGVDASEKFFSELAGVSDPEKKRKIIGKGFIDVFDREAHKIEDVKWLAQGTIYPDCIESLSITGTTIKSHHNVGGLPEKMNLRLCEPLRLLFKDEVRRVGRQLGMPEHLIKRQPFPGPGLAVRILGDITPEKVRILQDADKIFIDNLREAGLYDKVWQAGSILLPVQSVGVMGDERTYERAVALRAVTSTDAMTADWAHLPYEFLAKVSNEIINHVRGVNRVCYDISSKPPATIEWE